MKSIKAKASSRIITMKYFMFLFLLFFCTATFAQTTDSIGNFQRNNKQLIWQHIYNTPVSVQKFASALKIRTSISDVSYQDNQITAKLEKYKLNYQKYGGSYMKTAIFGDYIYSAVIVIDIKESKYRVTIKDFSSQTTSDKVVETTLLSDEISRNDGTFRDTKTVRAALGYFDRDFLEMFKYSPETGSDNW